MAEVLLFPGVRIAVPSSVGPSTYDRRAYIADAAVHAVTLIFALAAAATLDATAITQRDVVRAAALVVYGLSMVATLGLSAAYNLNRDPARAERLRRLDHAGIFLLIGGTYTPLAAVAFPGNTLSLVLIWLATLTGVALKLCFPRRYEKAGITAYVLLGWMILPMLYPLSTVLPREALQLLMLGCAIYTVGVGFHLAHRLPYHTVIWHLCVLAGAATHFLLMLRYIAPLGII